MANTVLVDRNLSDPRLNSGPMVTNADGGLHAGGRVSADFKYFRKPFICPITGKKSVLVNKKDRHGNIRWTVNEGQRVPLRESMPIMDALNAGYNVPIWTINAAQMRPDQWI